MESEASEHLRDKTADLVATGMGIGESERAAVREFGSPTRVAFELLEGPVPSWRTSLGVLCIFSASLMVLLTVAAYCSVGKWASFGMWANCAAPISLFLVLAAGCLARRSLSKVIVACAVPVSVFAGLIMSGNLLFHGGIWPRDQIKADRLLTKMEVNDLARELSVLNQGIRHYGLNGVKDPTAAAPRGWHGNFVMLPQFDQWQFNPTEVGLEPTPEGRFHPTISSTTRFEDEARPSWVSNARWIVQSTSAQLAQRTARLEEEDVLLARPPTRSAPLFWVGVGLTVVPAMMLWIASLLGVKLARLLRWVSAARSRAVA